MVSLLTHLAIGLLLFIFSHELADSLNRLSVRLNTTFPMLKKLPLSHLAGSPSNYKSSFYFFRIVGIFMVIAGLFFLGMEMVPHR